MARALPDLVSRIRVDSSGVDSAINSMVHGFSRADLAMTAAAAGIGLLILGGKSAMEIAEKHEKAENDLAQAYESQGLKLAKYQGAIDSFLRSNGRFTSDQSEVIDNYAKLTRAGLRQEEVQRVMNDAIDLAALKHIALSDAVDVLNAAEHGRMRGLIDLGITTKQLTDKDGNLLKGQKAISAAMTEVDQKVAHGRETLTKTEQASNRLSNSWQNIANKVGPPLNDAFSTLVGWLSDAVNWLDALGHNAAWNKWVSSVLGEFQNGIVRISEVWKAIVASVQWLIDHGQQLANWLGSGMGSGAPSGTPGRYGRASGGPVVPGSVYTVGEHGPETLVMGPRGGYVIPNSGGEVAGGNSIHITVNAATNANPYEIADEIAWIMKTRMTKW